MTEAPKKKRDYLDPVKEAQAVKALRESMAAVLGDDHELLMDTIEGETQYLETIDALLKTYVEYLGQAKGLAGVIEQLKARSKRLDDSAKSIKALIEQSMAIADLELAKRPIATLSMSKRAASLVITEESDIPARFWRAGDPVLDRSGLTEELRARAEALASLPEDPEARAAAVAALEAMPPIPGAELSNAAPTLTIRIA